ncbi:MAG: hypothetical protein AB2541_00350 [Candidatus Thiodiazotropha sp.]
MKEYTEEKPVCKKCGVPLVLNNWVIANHPFSGVVIVPLIVIGVLVLIVLLPETLSDYLEWALLIVVLIMAYIFPFKMVPALFSDLSIDYKRAKENGVADKIKQPYQLQG